jgi:homoserine dehydrogenase
MEVRMAFVGFGNVARAFARMLEARKRQLEDEFGLICRATAIATAHHGCVISDAAIDLNEAVRQCEGGRSLELPGAVRVGDAARIIEQCEADVIFETTPLNPENGEPAIGYIRSALERRIHVVTANKGPLAFAHRHLRDTATSNGVSFLFEGAVMDGTPIFNLVECCLPAVRVLGFEGILNSTTNHVLTGMREGRSFDDCLVEARRLGIVEANADYDIDGWDAAVKAAGLANVLMGADVRPADVDRCGIREVTVEELQSAAAKGCCIRLVARASESPTGPRLRVAPELVPLSSPLALSEGTSNVLLLHTDLMGDLAIFETAPGIEQTAYALLSDLLRIHNGRSQGSFV